MLRAAEQARVLHTQQRADRANASETLRPGSSQLPNEGCSPGSLFLLRKAYYLHYTFPFLKTTPLESCCRLLQ